MNKANIHIILVAASIALTACTERMHPDIDGGIITLGAYANDLGLAGSRAETIKSQMPETIGVYAEIEGNENRVFDNQCMYYREGEAVKSTSIDVASWPSDNLWPYTPTKSWIADKKYVFYGYAPYDAANTELVQTGVNINTFKFHNIPPLSATEYLVAKANVSVNSGVKPLLDFTHITSRLRFCFAIGEKYDQLRKIRVTSIKISDSGSGTPYWECNIELDGPNPDIKVVQSDKIYVSDAEIELIPEVTISDPSKPGLLLDTNYNSFSSAYNLLGKIANTTLTVTYDVYDKTDQKLRAAQVAKNVIDLSKWTFERGKCYNVKILVSPKYLYVLSDNDVVPDGLIEPDNE